MLLKIKEFRKLKKMSQQNLADKIDVSVRMFGDYEKQTADIGLLKLQKIAEILEVSIFDLVELSDTEKQYVATPLQSNCEEKIKELEERIGFYKEKIEFVERKLEDCEAEKKRIKTIS
jgi:transcriptional regulator with XRE-family HTH domain